MTSQRRIHVNFSSKDLYEKIIDIADKSKISQSKIAETLISQGMLSTPHGSKHFKDKELILDRESFLLKYKNAISRFSISVIKVYEDMEADSSHEGKTYNLNVFPKEIPITFKININVIDFIDVDRKIVNTAVVKSKLMSGFKSELINPTSFTGVVNIFPIQPRAILVFASCAEVSISERIKEQHTTGFSRYLDEMVIATAKIKTTMIPIYVNENASDVISFLDFDGISYKTFKNAAIKGWNKSRYSHSFYIQGVSDSRGGGYFIGMTYGALKHNFSEYKNFEYVPAEIKDNALTEKPGVFINIFNAGMKINFDKRSINTLKRSIDFDKIESTMANK